MPSFARTRFYHEWKLKQLAFREFARIENMRRYNRQRGFIINPFAYGGVVTDPYFANVVSLAHFDGTNGDTGPFADQIANRSPGWTRIAVGAQLSTGTKKYGSASLTNGGVGVYNADHADWDFGSGDFTVECWAQFLSTGAFHTIFAQWNSASGNKAPFLCYFDSTQHIQFGASTTNASWSFLQTSSGTFSTSTWYFIRLVRSGTSIRGLVDNAQVVSGTLTGAVVNNTDNVTLGNVANNPGTLQLNGFIDDFRATKGVARADELPTAAFPNS